MIAVIIFALIAVLIIAVVAGKIDWFRALIGIVALLVLWYLVGEPGSLDLRR